MPKVINPLLSLSATGGFGPCLIFRELHGQQIVQAKGIRIDAKSSAQLFHRTVFRMIVDHWNAHTETEKALIDPYIVGKTLTRYDWYIREYFKTGEDPLGRLCLVPCVTIGK